LNPPRKLLEICLSVGPAALATAIGITVAATCSSIANAEIPRSPMILGDESVEAPQTHSSFHDHPADPSVAAISVAAGIDTLGPVRWSLLKKAGATSIIDQQNWSQTASVGIEWDASWGAWNLGALVRRYPEHVHTAPTELRDLGETFKSTTSGSGRGFSVGWRFGPRLAQTPWVSWIRLVHETSLTRATVFIEDSGEVEKITTLSKLEILYLRFGIDFVTFGHGKAGLGWGIQASAPLAHRAGEKLGDSREQALARELNHKSAAALGLQISATVAR
jgi:hypothetical protein